MSYLGQMSPYAEIGIAQIARNTQKVRTRASGTFGKTPMQTFLDAIPMTKEKMIAA